MGTMAGPLPPSLHAYLFPCGVAPGNTTSRSKTSERFKLLADLVNRLPQAPVALSVVKGPLLILAGPGSGKTHVIMHCVAYLVAQRGSTRRL